MGEWNPSERQKFVPIHHSFHNHLSSSTALCDLFDKYICDHGKFGLENVFLDDFNPNGFHSEFKSNEKSKSWDHLSSEANSGDESG